MRKAILFVILLFAFTKADPNYECLQNTLQKMTNTSCPLVTPEVETSNRDEYSRLFISCIKGHYIINGCNETSWTNVCNDKVEDLASTSREIKPAGFHDTRYMKKYCNDDIIDPDISCIDEILPKISKNTCPQFAKDASMKDKKFSYKTIAEMASACVKAEYLKHGCNEDQWPRVCNQRSAQFNVKIDKQPIHENILQKTCNESNNDVAYKCLEQSMKDCPEVTHFQSINKSLEDVMRQQAQCFKRHFINGECELAEFERVCVEYTYAFFGINEGEKRKLAEKYCYL